MVDIATGQQRTDLPKTPLGNVAFAHGADFLVLSEPRDLRLLDPLTGRTGRMLRAPVDDVATAYLGAAQFAPPRGLLFQGTDSDVVRVIDLATNHPVLSLNSSGHLECPIATSPDGRWLAMGETNATRLYEIRSPETHAIAAQSLDPIGDIAFTSDGRQLTYVTSHFQQTTLRGSQVATSTFDADSDTPSAVTRRVNWRSEGGHNYSRFVPHATRDVGKVAVAPASDQVAVACELTGLHWQGPRGVPTWPEQISSEGFRTQVIEEHVLVTDASGPTVKPIDDPGAFDGKALERPCEGDPSVWRVRVPLARPFLADQTVSVIVRVRATAKGIELPSVRVAIGERDALRVEPLLPGEYTWLHAGLITAEAPIDTVEFVAISDADRAAALVIDRVMIVPVDYERGRDSQTHPNFGPLAFTPNGQSLVAILRGDRLASWEVDTGKLQHVFANSPLAAIGGASNYKCVAVGEQQLLAGRESGDVVRWEWPSARLLAPFTGPGGAVTALSLSPDETLLAVGTTPGKVRIVRSNSLETIADLGGHTNQIVALAFEPSGRRLWSGSRDGSIRRWDERDGQWRLTLVLTEGAAPIQTFQLASQAGKLAVLREGESVVHLWNLDRVDWRMIPELPESKSVTGSSPKAW